MQNGGSEIDVLLDHDPRTFCIRMRFMVLDTMEVYVIYLYADVVGCNFFNMKPVFIYYSKCGTCRKAAKWLRDNGIEIEMRDVVTHNPTQEELEGWLAVSGRPVAKFFNTSGLKYRAMHLSEVVKTASDSELILILASDGMLVKRPILVLSDGVLVGFNEAEWSTVILRR